jgi:hypothetical protein
MIAAMQANHPKVQVTDLVHATKTKSAEEVTKMFVDSASYILRAQVGGKTPGSKGSTKRTTIKTGKPLWDPKKLKEKDIFSCISYLKVEKIEGDRITVKNQLGGCWFISKDILEREMWSADHYAKEIKCTMTDLSEILEQCSDTIFAVQFKKKVDQKSLEGKLAGIKFSDLKKSDEIKHIAKEVSEGKTEQITCHLLESENHLGRSLVIDLNAPASNNFRQVDHRTIEWIVVRNVKYTLGRKAPGTEELPLKYNKDEPKW